jgi:dynein heavy chain, axonemal
VSKSGLPPREVALERKRRQYQAHDINRVLLERNLNYNTMELDGKPLESDLDLMLFDNQDFETFHNDPERWVQKGESRGVPARALRPSVGHGFGMEWIDVVVVGVDEKGYFQVVWQDRVGKTEEEEEDDDGRPKMSLRPRLRVLFDAEDPIVFAERLLFAERARRRAKEKMRHEIFVDCMPNEDVTTLRPEMRRRIADLAKATCKSLRSLSHSEARSMIDEVAMDFCRSMNRMTYTASEKEFVPKNLSLQSDLEIQGVEDLAKSRKLVTQGEDREYTSRLNAERNRGVIPQGTIALQCGRDASGNMITQDFDFASASSHFAFRTLFTQPEIITMLVRIQQQCKSLLDRRVFKLSGSATQSQRLEDFESSQGNHLREFVSYVDKEWIENICNCIMECLSGVSKGWFKIDETDENAYKMSNLRFFFQFVNFMIQDTLRDVVMKSLQEYRDMILRGTAAKSSLNSNTKLAPLFLTHLSFYSSSSFSGHDEKMEKKSVAEDDDKTIKIGYKDTPEKIAKSAIRVIRKALESLEGISQVERRVMNKLFWSSTPTVRAVQYMEPCVQKIVKQIAKHLRDSIVPVNEYKKQYEQYMEFLRVDENEYLTELIAKYVDDDDDDDDDNDDSAKTSSKTESSSSNKKDTLKRYEELSSRLTETQLAKLVVKIKELVVEHSEKAKNLEKTVPAMRHMKMFAVNCSDFRNHLIEKRQKLSSMMLLELAKKNVQATNKLLETYSEIQRSLKRTFTFFFFFSLSLSRLLSPLHAHR